MRKLTHDLYSGEVDCREGESVYVDGFKVGKETHLGLGEELSNRHNPIRTTELNMEYCSGILMNEYCRVNCSDGCDLKRRRA